MENCRQIWVTNFTLATCLQAAEAFICLHITSGNSVSLSNTIGFKVLHNSCSSKHRDKSERRFSIESVTKDSRDVWPWDLSIVTAESITLSQ